MQRTWLEHLPEVVDEQMEPAEEERTLPLPEIQDGGQHEEGGPLLQRDCPEVADLLHLRVFLVSKIAGSIEERLFGSRSKAPRLSCLIGQLLHCVLFSPDFPVEPSEIQLVQCPDNHNERDASISYVFVVEG